MKRIQELESENARLHALIDELQTGVNISNLEPNLLIVGQRAQEFVEQITQLDELLARTEHGPPPFLESTRKKVAQDVKALISTKKKRSDKTKSQTKKTAVVSTATTTSTKTRSVKTSKAARRPSPTKFK